MNNEQELVLSSTPLSESEETVTLNLFEEGDRKRGGLPQKKALAGRITCNPERCPIFSLPAWDTIIGQPVLSPDRTLWDFYLIAFPFTLHQTLNESSYYKEVTFLVDLSQSDATAFDLFPRNITQAVGTNSTYVLSPQFRIANIEASTGMIGRQVHFESLKPTIVSFGINDPVFYWTYSGSEEGEAVFPETKQTLIVLQVPCGTERVNGTIHYEVVIAHQHSDKKIASTVPHRICWNLSAASPFYFNEVISPPPDITQPAAADICVVCALPEEAEAFMHAAASQCGISFSKAFSTGHREYRQATIKNNSGQSLSLLLSWPPANGPIETALHLSKILTEFRPQFAFMTGICAGDRTRVALGDLIIADRAYDYETGKIVLGENQQPELLVDTKTYYPDDNFLLSARLFQGWQSAVSQIPRPISRRQQRDWLLNALLLTASGCVDDIPMHDLEQHVPAWREIIHELQRGSRPYLNSGRTLIDPQRVLNLHYGKDIFPYTDPPHPRSHIAPMASGNSVRSDKPFAQVRVPVRGTVAIDMEGVAFYRTITAFSGTRALLVKGVCDYADPDKDDTYHEYASLVSATYTLCFIQEYAIKHPSDM